MEGRQLINIQIVSIILSILAWLRSVRGTLNLLHFPPAGRRRGLFEEMRNCGRLNERAREEEEIFCRKSGGDGSGGQSKSICLLPLSRMNPLLKTFELFQRARSFENVTTLLRAYLSGHISLLQFLSCLRRRRRDLFLEDRTCVCLSAWHHIQRSAGSGRWQRCGVVRCGCSSSSSSSFRLCIVTHNSRRGKTSFFFVCFSSCLLFPSGGFQSGAPTVCI